jgi:hypothetical protein
MCHFNFFEKLVLNSFLDKERTMAFKKTCPVTITQVFQTEEELSNELEKKEEGLKIEKGQEKN